jgi:hypothetical protein
MRGGLRELLEGVGKLSTADPPESVFTSNAGAELVSLL